MEIHSTRPRAIRLAIPEHEFIVHLSDGCEIFHIFPVNKMSHAARRIIHDARLYGVGKNQVKAQRRCYRRRHGTLSSHRSIEIIATIGKFNVLHGIGCDSVGTRILRRVS
jgi:hypothetical protein